MTVGAMSASKKQRQFNRYPKAFRHSFDLPKAEVRDEADRLVAEFLAKGGEITKLPAQKFGKGPAKIFTKDAPRSAQYDRDTSKYMSGRFLAPSKLQFTSKPVREDSATRRDVARQAGVSHADFSGAVTQIGNKLVPRQAEPEIIRDQADSIVDASARATIRDDISPHIDQEHMRRLKLAA
jgi:hypothetical protein